MPCPLCQILIVQRCQSHMAVGAKTRMNNSSAILPVIRAFTLLLLLFVAWFFLWSLRFGADSRESPRAKRSAVEIWAAPGHYGQFLKRRHGLHVIHLPMPFTAADETPAGPGCPLLLAFFDVTLMYTRIAGRLRRGDSARG